ncbi:MAG: hypothetical protein L0Y58_19610 [Verrucomicrobia subdivision 3 bacterium]|nr:hypothetical protein [Limisphaerales bacterium]
MRPFSGLIAILFAVSASGAEPEAAATDLPRIPPVEPDKALGTFQIRPGFRLELAAAEPQVLDPVALCFDEDGRLFVVEMRDYSERRDERLGRIRVLEDSDNDGRFDISTVFAEELAWPTAVIAYGGGVFVAASPDILFLKDTDGDGQADERRVVFTGFGKGTERLNVQALPNSFNWSLDNRIHGATGPNGGSITRPDAPDAPAVNLRGRDFSFDPRTLDFRAESGGSQHGLSFDNHGRKFVCSNSSHIQAVMYEERYAERNHVYSLPRALVDIAVDGGAAPVYRISPDEPWRVIRTQWRVAGKVPGPIEGGGRPSGYFTSATGVTIYRGDAYGPEYVGDAFIGDCGSNLVHRKKLRQSGVELQAERAPDEQKTEFLASKDNWFRPVQFANGPDGCLYLADMYREVIEHPWSLPPGIKKHLDLNSGNDRGRIYRIVPANFQRGRPARLSSATTEQLAATLTHPNGWRRDTAARLLYERRDRSAVTALRAVMRGAKPSEGRLHALYALNGLGALTPADLMSALDDAPPEVRQHALRLSEPMLKSQPALAAKVLQMRGDANAQVRYQLAFTLGAFDADPAVLAAMFRDHADDRWARAALSSSLDTSDATRLATAAEVFRLVAPHRPELLPDLAMLIGAQGQTGAVRVVLQYLTGTADNPFAIANTLAAGLHRSGKTFAAFTDRRTAEHLAKRALQAADSDSAAITVRKDAVAYLAHIDFDLAKPALSNALTAPLPDIRAAAVRALGRFRNRDVPGMLLPIWNRLGPDTRLEAMTLLLSRGEWASAVLNAIANEALDKSYLTPQQMQFLINHPEPPVYQLARTLFSVTGKREREAVVERLMPATRLAGDPKRGAAIYRERCASCHRAGTEGFAVGPDIATMKASGKEKLLVNIIDPDREAAPNFQNYLVETVEGDTVSGLLVRDAPGSVTLTAGGGVETTLIRAQVRRLTPLGKSLMPEGLEQGLSLEQMSDLLEFLSAP